jgi:hypothetical protein
VEDESGWRDSLGSCSEEREKGMSLELEKEELKW